MNKKIKEKIEKFNIPERSLAGIGIIICVILIISMASYGKLRTNAFKLDNNIANEQYNILADNIANKGYSVNMVANEDDTFSIIAKYNDNNINCDIHVTVDNDGEIISNFIETSSIYKIDKNIIRFDYDKLKNHSILTYYGIFNETLNLFGDSISREDFQILINDSFEYSNIRHGQYQSEKYIYEIYFKNDKIHINAKLK